MGCCGPDMEMGPDRGREMGNTQEAGYLQGTDVPEKWEFGGDALYISHPI